MSRASKYGLELAKQKLIAKAAVETPRSKWGTNAMIWLLSAPDREWGGASEMGNRAHAQIEGLIDHPKPIHDYAGTCWAILAYIEACEAIGGFEAHATEQTVVNRTPGQVYAGTGDLFGSSWPDSGDLKSVSTVVDIKTGKTIKAEYVLQLGALRNAPEWVAPDGTCRPAQFKAERGLILHLRPEGWAWYEAGAEAMDLAYDQFLGLLAYKPSMKWLRKIASS